MSPQCYVIHTQYGVLLTEIGLEHHCEATPHNSVAVTTLHACRQATYAFIRNSLQQPYVKAHFLRVNCGGLGK